MEQTQAQVLGFTNTTPESGTSSDIKIDYIHPEQVAEVWPVARIFVKLGLDHGAGEYDIDDAFMRLVNGNWALLLIHEDHIVTVAVMEYPQFKGLLVPTIGGERYVEWREMLDDYLVKWAREQGCKQIECMARKGQVRALAHLGYIEQYRYLTREV